MKSEAYTEWINLFDDNLAEIWAHESSKFRKVAMIYFVFEKELNTIRSEVEKNFKTSQSLLMEEVVCDEPKPQSSKLSNNSSATNATLSSSHGPDKAGLDLDAEESPDLFKLDPNANDNRTPDNDSSPTFNRRKLFHRHKRFKQDLGPVLLPASKSNKNLDGSHETVYNSDAHKKEKKILESPIKAANNTYLCKKESTDLKIVDSDIKTEFKTPDIQCGQKINIENEDILDSTIIDGTPIPSSIRKSRIKSSKSHSSKQKMNSKRAKSKLCTLTQMLSLESTRDHKPNKKVEKVNLIDLPSSMEIDEILEYVNNCNDQNELNTFDTDATNFSPNQEKIYSSKGNHKDQKDLNTFANVDVSNVFMSKEKMHPKREENKPERKTYFKNIKLSQNFLENYDKIDKPVSDQRVKPQQDVLRGKERKKLPGWSCKDCQKFYEQMNLPPDELEQKMNLCSKHRSNNPLDNTFPGFWNMTMPDTPPHQKTPEKSMVFYP